MQKQNKNLNMAKSNGLYLILALTALTYVHSSVITRERRDVGDKQIDDIIDMIGPRAEVDLVVLIDRSRGMEMQNFYLKEKRYIERFIRQYATLSDDYVRIAGLTFSQDVEVAFDSISSPNAGYQNTGSINKARLFEGNSPYWDNVQYYYDPARFVETNMIAGLTDAREIFRRGRERRPGINQVLFISTDGDYRDFSDTSALANQLGSNDNIKIFALGVGSWIGNNEGNVQALVTQTGYYALYNVWVDMLELYPTKYTPDTTPDQELFEPMPVSEGFCNGMCNENSVCTTDIDTGAMQCLCYPGYTPHNFTSPMTPFCKPCPSLHYKTAEGNEACRTCPPPMYTDQSGSTSYDQCLCPQDVTSIGNELQDCTDQCTGQCGDNEKCSYTGTRTWECSCADGWENTNPQNQDNIVCDRSANNCAQNPCRNGGTCVDLHESYMCSCEMGYEGEDCGSRQDPCDNNICLNGGTCTSDGSTSFDCQCMYPWTGAYCGRSEPTTIAPTTIHLNSTVEPSVTPAPQKDDDDDMMLYLIIGAAAGGALLLLLFIIIICCCCCRKKEEPEPEKDPDVARDGSRLYRKNRANSNKTFSNRFSDFWRKKTLTPGSFYQDGMKGLPSVPPRRRPDLLGHVDEDGFTTVQSDHVIEYAEYDNATVQDNGGMEGWQRYVNDISGSGLVQRAVIVKLAGKHSAPSDKWEYTDSEIDKLQTIMDNEDVNVPALVQQDEYHIHTNDGSVAVGKTIGSTEEPHVLCVGKTNDFIIVGVANGNTDSGQCLKEIQWITDHIKNEGY